jgi:hypothetical protein
MSSSVVVFPLCRQRKLLRDTANVLRSKHGETATLFWRDTARSLLQHLAAKGIDPAAAEEEVRNLLYAVLAEIEANVVSARGETQPRRWSRGSEGGVLYP